MPLLLALALLLSAAPLLTSAQNPPAGPIVKTRQGKIQGVQEGPLRVFRGIPYAPAPVGPLRFRPPQPLRKHKGVRPATQFGGRATQPGGPDGVQGGEDCLYLNVWAPALPKQARRPVVVWVHGGAFTGGSGNDNDTWTFAAQDTIVAVSINYRLGALGFLPLPQLGPEYADAGNCGLLDAVAALRWVHDNIAAFGGDPARVTVMGESAGAKLVGGLLVTPQARPLFRQAILESGAVQAVRDTATAAAVRRQLLQELQLTDARALLTRPAADLIRAQAKFTAANRGLQAFGPVLDGRSVPAAPLDFLRRPGQPPLRVLLGSNLEEAILFTGPGSVLHEPNEAALNEVFGPKNGPYAWRAYQQRRQQEPDPAAWNNVLTDYLYRLATYRLADTLAARQVPTWLYRFDWHNATMRPQHAQELAFVWNAPKGTSAAATTAAPGTPSKAADPALAARMHAYWTQFIKTGSPGPAWPAYVPGAKQVMLFDAADRVEPMPAPYKDPAFPVQGYWR